MGQKSFTGKWILTKKSYFNDDREFKKCQVGRVSYCDGPLLIVDFSGNHVPLRHSDVIFLNKDDETWKNQ